MLDRIYLILIAALLVAAPVAVGGVHTRVALGLAALAVVAWIVQGWVFDGDDARRTVVSIPSLAFWLLAGVSVVQLVPLPQWLVGWVDPQRLAHVERGWAVLFPDRPAPHAWMPLSLDPEQTADRALRWVVLAMTALLAANHGRLRHGWRNTLRMVTGAGLVVLAVGAIQVSAGADEVLFIYEPRASITAYTTFISPNHAGVFFGLTSLCAFGWALRSIQQNITEAIAASAAGLILMVATVDQNSVGAILGFGLGWLALIGLFLQTRQARRWVSKRRARQLSIAALSLPVLAPAATFLVLRVGPAWMAHPINASALGDWISRAGGGRLDLMSAAIAGSGDYPFVGAGAGAVGRALGPYVEWGALPVKAVPTIENEPVQWLFEYGWLAGPTAIFLMLSYFVYAFRAHLGSRKLRYGALLAVALFLGFNAQFHFPFFTLGITVPAVFVIECALAHRLGSSASAVACGFLSTHATAARWVVAAALTLTTAGCAVANLAYGVNLNLISQSPTPRELERFNRLIPTDGQVDGRAAYLARWQDQVGPLADRAVALEPTAQMKLFVARPLWRRGHRRRALELYQQAFSPDYPQVPGLWIRRYLVSEIGDPAAIARALARASADQWRRAARAIRRQSGDRAVTAFAMTLIDAHPRVYEPYRMAAEAYLRRNQPKSAEIWARLLVSRASDRPHGDSPEGIALLAEIQWRQGRRSQARKLIVDHRDAIDEDPKLATTLVRLRTPDPREAAPGEVQAIQQFQTTYCSQPTEPRRRTWCSVAEGWLAEQRGALDDAKYAYARVQRKFNRPDFLGAFLARHGRCVELNEAISRLKNYDASVGGLESMTDDCADTNKD